MDIVCLILGICCWIFNSTPLHIVTICLSAVEFFLLLLIKTARREPISEYKHSILISILSLASGIVCLCV